MRGQFDFDAALALAAVRQANLDPASIGQPPGEPLYVRFVESGSRRYASVAYTMTGSA